MARTPEAPINPEVLAWAIDESGFTVLDLANSLNLPAERITSWTDGTERPSVAQLKSLAIKLRRPSALFYLPERPSRGAVPTKLRHGPRAADRPLTPKEIQAVRWARRIQEGLGWLLKDDLDTAAVQVPASSLDTAPDEAAAAMRAWLGLSVNEQQSATDARVAFNLWRQACEARGIFVLQFELTQNGLSGFSAPDPNAPVLAVNTAYVPQARTFTLGHELGHLALNDVSACIDFITPADNDQGVERWCERFAASLLIPLAALRSAFTAAQPDCDIPSLLAFTKEQARRLKVSQRAMALRMIEAGLATGSLYGAVEKAAPTGDVFPAPSDSGGGGMTAPQKRIAHLGTRAITTYLDGARRGSLSSREVADYLRLATRDLDDIEQLLEQRSGAA
ncbi:MAG: ImmA/IrrE family metallo-endopeptidase [Acidimicrobiales bacterium]